MMVMVRACHHRNEVYVFFWNFFFFKSSHKTYQLGWLVFLYALSFLAVAECSNSLTVSGFNSFCE